MSPTFRSAVRVQKRLLVTEHGNLKELLKLKTDACSFTQSLSIEMTLKRSSALRREFPENYSSMFEGLFLYCKNCSCAIVHHG